MKRKIFVLLSLMLISSLLYSSKGVILGFYGYNLMNVRTNDIDEMLEYFYGKNSEDRLFFRLEYEYPVSKRSGVLFLGDGSRAFEKIEVNRKTQNLSIDYFSMGMGYIFYFLGRRKIFDPFAQVSLSFVLIGYSYNEDDIPADYKGLKFSVDIGFVLRVARSLGLRVSYGVNFERLHRSEQTIYYNPTSFRAMGGIVFYIY